jgi:arylsulfatase A-like enzyme
MICPGLCAVLMSLEPAPAAPSPKKPNILVILADDMGYSDAGCYGGEIRTPNVDRLAAGGLRFTQFYNTARCWPSRASILTGHYAQAVRRDEMPGIDGGSQGIRPRWAHLLPEYLKPLGYRSYHSGKWHVDGQPVACGFDRSYWLENCDRFFSPQDHYEDDVKLPAVKPDGKYYATTFIAEHAIKCLKEHAARFPGRPFFEYLAFTSPHFPLHALPEDIAVYRERYQSGWDVIREERYARMKQMGLVNCALSARDPITISRRSQSEAELLKLIGPAEVTHAVAWKALNEDQQKLQATKMSLHAAMVHRMDIEIGRVLEQLKAMGAIENTVIFFLSDNGATAEQIVRGDGHDRNAPAGSAASYFCMGPGWSTAANTPFRLHKAWVHEGGISTPLIVHWPAGLKTRGELRANPGHLIDLLPTILDLAGGEPPATFAGQALPPFPGKSLVPAFSRDNAVQHEYFWWNHKGTRAIRVGDWKLVADNESPWEFYDLRTDRSESRNLVKQEPELARQLETEWNRRAEEFRKLANQEAPASAQKANIKL